MKQGTIHAAWAALALVASAVAPAGAEPLRLAQTYGPEVLPPYEVVTVIRSAGLDPLTRPFLRGRHYVIRAIDRDDREVRVIVDARRGEIMRIVPVAVASRGMTMGPYERMDGYALPPGHDVEPGYGGGEPPSVVYGDEPTDEAAPRPPAAVPGVPSARAMPPPVMRQAPVRGAELQSLPEPRVITADPGRAGVLPPPPERFRQHTVAPAKPKPAKRNVASIPKQAPLPKPRPEPRVEPQPQAGTGQAGHEAVGKSTASNADAPAAIAPPAAAAQPSASGAAAEKPAVPPPAPRKAPAAPRHPADELPN